MKKLTSTLLVITLAIISIHDITAARMSKSQRRQWNTYLRQRNQTAQPQATPQPAPTQLTKQEAQTIKDKKREVAQDAKALEKEIANTKKAKTPEEKAAAQEKAYEMAQELIQALNDERTLNKDIYSEEELMRTDKAKLIYAKLDMHKRKFAKALENKQKLLDAVTKKGILWNSALPGKEKEYKTLTNDIKTLKERIEKIDQGMQKPKAIVGESWINAYNVMVGAAALGVGAVVANVALFGSAGIVAATAASYLPTTWTGAFYAATKLQTYYSIAKAIISQATATIDDPNTPEEKRQEAILQRQQAEKDKNESEQILRDYKDKKITKAQLEQKQQEIEARKQAEKK